MIKAESLTSSYRNTPLYGSFYCCQLISVTGFSDLLGCLCKVMVILPGLTLLSLSCRQLNALKFLMCRVWSAGRSEGYKSSVKQQFSDRAETKH